MTSYTMDFNMFLKSFVLFLYVTPILTSCRQQYTAEQIITESIEMHGGHIIDTASIEFDFRDIHYRASHNNGLFQYERWLRDSIHDVLNNEGFTRYINGREVSIPEEDKIKYSNSVNSVIYFALLPYKLDDPAVNAQLNGETKIDGKDYFKIKVTFKQQGGGTDYEDEFAYWFHKKDYSMDYLSYLYYTDGGGTRFRKAYNHRRIGGVLLADYQNYKGPFPYDVTRMDSLFRENELELLSDINLENITVE